MRRAPGGTRRLVPLSAVRLLGRHLLGDVLAAVAVSTLVGAPAEAMTRAVETFTGLEHALEPAGEIDGVRFVNDSKATNVEAARLAIESFPRGVVPILGGRFKGGDLRGLRDAVRGRARLVVAIGEARPLVHAALDDVVPVRDAADLAEAVRLGLDGGAPRRHGAAGARLRELRHVPRLRGARAGVQAGGRASEGGTARAR